MKIKCALVGSRYFGAEVFETLRKEEGVEFTSVVAPSEDDRLALAARAAGISPHILTDPRTVPGEAIAEGTDLILAAHTHARISDEALARARFGGVGYHPSLLPRHRGIAAVEWTVLEGDPIAGGSIYHLADGWDAGAVAAQDWCFVLKGETARDLWERALAPMGLKLLSKVVHHARLHGEVPAYQQDERFATKAPRIRRSVVLAEEVDSPTTPLVVSIVGTDRQGIVSSLAERAQRYGANWASSRMTRIAGEFAGMVHLEVPREHADALAASLRQLESSGLQVVIAKSEGAKVADKTRTVELELIGDDRLGIVSGLTKILAARGISIEDLNTEILGKAPDKQIFKISARLLVPAVLSLDALRQELGTLASELMLDIALGELATD